MKKITIQFTERELAIIEILSSMGIDTGTKCEIKNEKGEVVYLAEECFPLQKKIQECIKSQIKKS